MTVTPLEWEWREWVLGEGRYACKGRRSQPRPAKFPLPIPKMWWVRLAAFLARRKPTPKPPLSTIPAPFNGKGMVLLEPTGGTEDIAAAKRAGFTYLLLNLGHVSGGDWTTHRARAKELGVYCVPWKRIYGPNDVRIVEQTAGMWQAPASAHNLENPEATTTFPPVNLASLAGSYGTRPRAVITEPWVQPIDWAGCTNWVCMPETFMNVSVAYNPKDLTDHAHSLGFKHVVPMFGWGEWSDSTRYVAPATYLNLWHEPFNVYFGDGKEEQYGDWQ